MKYCHHCGAPMEDEDAFCARCGTGAASNRPGRRNSGVHSASGIHSSSNIHSDSGIHSGPEIHREPVGKLCCELAYAGTHFWAPLLICPKEKYAKYCANQGLWVLILSAAACSLIRILGAVNELFLGSFPGILLGGIYSFLFLLFLAFMLYLLWNCVKNALAIHRDEEPEGILFFDRIRVIR